MVCLGLEFGAAVDWLRERVMPDTTKIEVDIEALRANGGSEHPQPEPEPEDQERTGAPKPPPGLNVWMYGDPLPQYASPMMKVLGTGDLFEMFNWCWMKISPGMVTSARSRLIRMLAMQISLDLSPVR